MSTIPEPFFMSRKNLIFHIKSFREGSVQHFNKINNIFESENKQKQINTGPAWDPFYHTLDPLL